ncbi:MAG: hypothetical protein JW808_08270 [Victivallales bacterium]|nr:hypothetical protein [Victivallales bacterium]
MKTMQKKYAMLASNYLKGAEEGQAIAEYSVLVVLFVGTILMMVTLLSVFSDYGWRILNLIGSDFP